MCIHLVCSVYDGLSAVPLPPAAPVISDVCATSCSVKYEQPEIQVDGPPVTGYFLEAHTLNGPWIRVNNIPITGNEVSHKASPRH